jgi:hypothetical protein
VDLSLESQNIGFCPSKLNPKCFEFGLEPLSLGPQILAKLYENKKGFEKKIPKNSFCFKLSEIFTLTAFLVRQNAF